MVSSKFSYSDFSLENYIYSFFFSYFEFEILDTDLSFLFFYLKSGEELLLKFSFYY